MVIAARIAARTACLARLASAGSGPHHGRVAQLAPVAAHVARVCAAAALLAAASAASLGCSREPSSDVVAEPTPSVPTDVVFYTHVLYGGDDAYLIDGRWFRPAATGWVVFTKEPLELALIRRTLEQGHRSSWFGR